MSKAIVFFQGRLTQLEILTSSPGPNAQEVKYLDLHIAISQLAVELLSQAPRNIRKRYSTEASKLSKAARAKLKAADGEREEGLMEIIEGLEDLGTHSSG